jgi:hypothetical protein
MPADESPQGQRRRTITKSIGQATEQEAVAQPITVITERVLDGVRLASLGVVLSVGLSVGFGVGHGYVGVAAGVASVALVFVLFRARPSRRLLTWLADRFIVC